MPWNFDSDRSIYTQLIEQIKNRIVTGYYPPGSKLDPVRVLAAEAMVNPNTMQRALAELERMGLVCAKRTSGRFVTEDEAWLFHLKQEAAKDAISGFFKQMEDIGFDRQTSLALIQAALEDDEQEHDSDT